MDDTAYIYLQAFAPSCMRPAGMGMAWEVWYLHFTNLTTHLGKGRDGPCRSPSGSVSCPVLSCPLLSYPILLADLQLRRAEPDRLHFSISLHAAPFFAVPIPLQSSASPPPNHPPFCCTSMAGSDHPHPHPCYRPSQIQSRSRSTPLEHGPPRETARGTSISIVEHRRADSTAPSFVSGMRASSSNLFKDRTIQVCGGWCQSRPRSPAASMARGASTATMLLLFTTIADY
ncbi:hypothetical protein BKA65DRAFT_30965 [Rhexocercosporidium sp. MPI-PUGE-AT-0058]|nr:hypothetical protein BKA65DRAFT_30965 [Rhexocercosporidium sp. MPI-PUGE-AT-0058]